MEKGCIRLGVIVNLMVGLTPYIPEIIISFTTIFILFKNKFLEGDVFSFSIFFLLVCVVSLYIFNINDRYFIFNQYLIVDTFASTIKIILYILTIVVLFLSFFYLEKSQINSNDFCSIVLISVIGMSLIISCNDLIILYLGIELQSLSFYILASMKRNSNLSTEAGLKYFILGALASGLLLFGLSFLYGILGTLNLVELKLLLQNNGFGQLKLPLVTAMIFLLSALLFKLPAAPFHNWAPDVYYGAPTIVTTLFAVVPKIAIIAILIKLLFITFSEYSLHWTFILILCSVSSLIIGSLGALYQFKIKRLLAYSTISHVGFILMGLSMNLCQGVEASFFYLLIYIVLNLTIFTIVLASIDFMYFEIDSLIDFIKIYLNNKTIGLILTLSLFSIAGVPPLIGFYSKFYVLLTVVGNNFYYFAILAVVVSVISCFYYIRLIKIMFFDSTKVESKNIILNNGVSVLLSLLATLNIFFCVYGGIFFELTKSLIFALFV